MAEWTPHVDGFVKGNIGVFPGLFGEWEVWNNFSGEWNRSDPPAFALRRWQDYIKDRNPPYVQHERTREETIDEAKRLAEIWLESNPVSRRE